MRTYGNVNYDIKTYEATHLWIQIREKYLSDYYKGGMKEAASGIHLVFIAGILAIPFFIWGLTYSYFTLKWLFIVIALVCFVVALYLDSFYEDVELRFLYFLDDETRNDVDMFASRILQNRFSTTNNSES